MVCASEAIKSSVLHTTNFKTMTTNTETTNATRKLILVKTDEDAGEGSLRAAIIKGNEAIERGEKVEIRFEKNMTIEASTSYQLTKGDWLINDYRTKNIVINGEKANGPLFVIGEYRDYSDLNVDASRISLSNSKVEGGDGVNGGGGGLGAGSALLHFNGHVKWRDSVIQGNEVKGGQGTAGAKGGRGFYRDYEKTRHLAANGEAGGKGGSFNSGSENSHTSVFGKGGNKGFDYTNLGSSVGERGTAGNHARYFGEGGGGGGGGGGGTNQVFTYDGKPASEGNGKYWGGGGIGGNGGSGDYGAGGGAGGGGGGNAGTEKTWDIGWQTERTPNWTASASGSAGKGGFWATNGTQAALPYRANPGDPGKGGDGASLGVFTSFALPHTADSSLTLDNIDFIDNKAEGANGTGRFRTIFSKHIDIKYNDVNILASQRPATGGGGKPIDKYRLEKTNGTINFNADATDKNSIHDLSGKFVKIASQDPTSVIESTSYEINPTMANIEGKRYNLNADKDHIISLDAFEDESHSSEVNIKGAETFLQAVSKLTKYVFKTPTEQEIRNSHTGWIKTASVTDGVVADHAAELNTGAIADYASKKLIKKGVGLISKKIPGFDILYDAFTTQLKEDARIEKELSIKRQTDLQGKQIKSLIPKDLTISPIVKNHVRTNDIFNNFVMGKHQIIFGANIMPEFSYNTTTGIVKVAMSDGDRLQKFNKVRTIAELHLTGDQQHQVANLANAAKYFESLLHTQQFGWTDKNGIVHKEDRYVLAQDTQWKYLTTPDKTQAPVASVGNDRVIIRRAEGIATTEQLKVYTHQGDDRVIGDDGNSLISGGSGNDHIAPGKGDDKVLGGIGFDTVDYTGIDDSVSIKSNEGGESLTATISDEGDNKSTDTITGIESFRTRGGNNIDLTHLKKPDETLSTADGRKADPSYMVATGSGGEIKGSQFTDNFLISYTSEFNKDAANSTKKLTILDGNNGKDTLVIDGLINHISKGNRKFELVTSELEEQKGRGDLYDITGEKREKILSYDNITFVDFYDLEDFDFYDLEYKETGLTRSTSKSLASLDFNQLDVSEADDSTNFVVDGSLPFVGESGTTDPFSQTTEGDSKILSVIEPKADVLA